MSGQGFFPGGMVTPVCPRCNVHFMPGDNVRVAPIEDGRDPETREHIDCDNPQNGVIDMSSPVGRAFRRLKGER